MCSTCAPSHLFLVDISQEHALLSVLVFVERIVPVLRLHQSRKQNMPVLCLNQSKKQNMPVPRLHQSRKQNMPVHCLNQSKKQNMPVLRLHQSRKQNMPVHCLNQSKKQNNLQHNYSCLFDLKSLFKTLVKLYHGGQSTYRCSWIHQY